MPIYRTEKTKDFTIMSNAHLREGRLSLKAKGLLSYMLSLPDDWRFSTQGLIANCREGADAVRKALCELEAAGYLRRTRIRSENGSFAEGEWSIFEKTGGVFPGLPQTENPQREKPITGSADTENPTLLNTIAIHSITHTFKAIDVLFSFIEEKRTKRGTPLTS